MVNITDLTGNIYGRLTVISYSHKTRYGAYWNCECICGSQRVIRSNSLIRGRTISCGCATKDRLAALAIHHHGHGSPEYAAWHAMKQRCINPKNKHFKHYGGRGITICDSWMDTFESFLNDMGIRPSDRHSLDRKNTNGNYSPENCRWATDIEQANNKRNNVFLTYMGTTKSLRQWMFSTGIDEVTLGRRFRKGLSIDDIFKPTKRSRVLTASHQECV